MEPTEWNLAAIYHLVNGQINDIHKRYGVVPLRVPVPRDAWNALALNYCDWTMSALPFIVESEADKGYMNRLLLNVAVYPEDNCTECGGKGVHWTEWSDKADANPELSKLVVYRPDPADGTVLIKCKCRQ